MYKQDGTIRNRNNHLIRSLFPRSEEDVSIICT